MSLSSNIVRPSIAVSEIDKATEFYEGTLGLSSSEEESDDSRIYACGGGTSIHVYTSPGSAGAARGTLATWYVEDLGQVVDELGAAGLAFERYDDAALTTDEKGIHEPADGRVAWFKDPDGNTFAIEEQGRS